MEFTHAVATSENLLDTLSVKAFCPPIPFMYFRCFRPATTRRDKMFLTAPMDTFMSPFSRLGWRG